MDDIDRPYQAFGQWLKSRRMSRGWTQQDLAAKMRYTVHTVRKFESGERAPSSGFLQGLADVLGEPVPNPSVLRARPQRIPRPTTRIVGREEDSKRIRALFDGLTRLVTLTGPPGIGKTRLAVDIAWEFDGLEDGAWFIPLEDVVDAASVPMALIERLGLSQRSRRNPQAQLVEHLAAQETLLVLDGCEHLLEIAPLVSQLLAGAPRLRVLLTSREALRIQGEARYTVPPLAWAERGRRAKWPGDLLSVAALRLFADRLQMVRSEPVTYERAVIIAEICRLLEGVPLALELTAATAESLELEEILERVRAGEKLPLRPPRDAPAHHRSVELAIDRSYQLLSKAERTVFAHLGVFAGSFTHDAVRAVCRVEAQSGAEAVLEALWHKSLIALVPGAGGPRGRYVALQAIREFMRARLDADEAQALRSRHCAFYTTLAREAEQALVGRNQAEWMRLLEEDRANFEAALAYGLQWDPDAATALAGALWRFFWLRGYFSEGRRWLEQALALSDEPTADRARVLVGLGVLARLQADYGEAEKHLEAAQALTDQLELPALMGMALLNRGAIAENRGDYSTAAELAADAESAYARAGDLRGVGQVILNRGMLHLDRDNLTAARAHFERSLEIFSEIGDLTLIALAAGNLGWTLAANGEADLAAKYYSESLAISDQLGDIRGLANTMASLGRLTLAQQDRDAARRNFVDALECFRELGEVRGCGECLFNLGLLEAGGGDAIRAVHLLASAAAIRERIDAPLWPAEQRAHDDVAAELRRCLGDGFQTAWRAGQALTLEEAILLALK